MPFDKRGKHHQNPATARQADQQDEPAKAPAAGQEHEAPAVEIHKKPEGGYKTVTHHAAGDEERDHPHFEHAVDHARQVMGEGGDGDGDEVVDQAQGQCPACGGPMKDGVCQQCGYSEEEQPMDHA